ncbi:hypothetical protein BDN71DRAFT_1456709 [Pleurotus eryngii]|uniref:Uncharacterized protein n=1 Tax=Pleurotus eryngii TaxID=5323 RepID=A0A9P5ZJ31_PLEER|nr:hypothetical protein BDN71DRAFT_1456709 [Pleurotus eryngii]
MVASLLARMQGTDLNRQGSASDTRADTQCALSEEVDEFLRSIVLDMDNGSEEPSSPGEIAFKEAGLPATSTMNGAVSSHVPGEAAELVEEGEILDPPVLALYPSHLVSLVRENLTRRGGGSTIAPDVLQQKITELFTDDVCRSLAGLNKEFNAQLNAQIEIKLDEVQNALSSRVKTSDPAENGELAHSPDHPAVCKVASDVSSSDSDADSSSKSGVESKTLRTPEKNYGKGTPMDQGKDEGKDKNNTSRNVTLPDRPKPHIPRLRRNSMNSSSIAPEIDVLYVPRRYSAPFPSSTHNPRSPPSLYRDPDRPAPLSCKDERMLSAHQMSQVAPHDLSGAYSMKRKRDREDYLPYDSPASSSSSSRSRSRSDSPARYVHRLPKRREDLVSYIPGHHRSAYGKHSSDTRSAPSMPGASKPHTRTKRRRMAEGQAGWELRESEKVDGPTHGDTVTSPPMSAATPPPLTASSTTVEPNDDIPRQHPNGLEAGTAPPSIPSQNFSYPLPSLWDVKDGLPSPGILSIDFVVDPQTSTQLCIPRAGQNGPDRASQLPFRLQLLCTLDEAWNDLTFDPSSVTPLQMAEEVLKMEVQWPRQGDLIVQVNEGTPWCCTYMPKDLGLSSPPLDLTTSVREGQNTIRLIQLSDMSRHIFVLHASSRDQTPESTPLSADFYKLLMQPQLF